ARAALVGMAFDREGVAVVVLQPLRLLVEGGARLRRQFARIGLEEDAIADIDDEVLGTAGNGGAGTAQAGLPCIRVVGASRQPDDRHQDGGQLGGAKDAHDARHSGGSLLNVISLSPRYQPKSLSEGSVNLYTALRRTPMRPDRPQTF